eukprot:3341273-Rhodomonas_salina.1
MPTDFSLNVPGTKRGMACSTVVLAHYRRLRSTRPLVVLAWKRHKGLGRSFSGALATCKRGTIVRMATGVPGYP